MKEFDNIFDAAIARADGAIVDLMGVSVTVISGALTGSVLRGVFDDPESISYVAGGVRIEGVSPSVFVNAPEASQLKRADALVIDGANYWVDRVSRKDGGGGCHIWLGVGDPPTDTRRR